jgi:hypothetical protein
MPQNYKKKAHCHLSIIFLSNEGKAYLFIDFFLCSKKYRIYLQPQKERYNR